MPGGGVQHRFGFVEFAQEFHADDRMPAFLVMIHRFADVVQQSGATRQRSIKPEFVGDDLREIRHLQAVPQHVLTITRAKVQPAEQRNDRPGQVGNVRFLRRVFTVLQQLLVDFLCRRRDDFLDARRMNSAVLHQFFQA